MEFIRTEIPDVIIIKPNLFQDERGFFMEFFKSSEFENVGLPSKFVQDNHSKSKKGVLRGLHYQLEPFGQGKLVRCIRGRIYDVAVDVRKGSPWYGKFVAVELSEENKLMIWIPPGFAHGFLALEDSEVIYKVTAEYSPEHDRGILWSDPDISIPWPEKNPIVSKKDASLPPLKFAENNFFYNKK